MDERTELPSPLQFDKYLPYACFQLGIDIAIVITPEAKNVYDPSGRLKFASKITVKEQSNHPASVVDLKSPDSTVVEGLNFIKLKTVYNPITEDLIQIKFLKNKLVPFMVFKVISLIVKFYPRLTSIVINNGLDQQGLYELSKLLSKSNVTDVILDNNRIPEANYYILFDVTSTLNYLSLSKCSLNDIAIEKLMSKMQRSSLAILNLSSNAITDNGAMVIGDFLRQNRKLLYLNLADNMITDVGANSIFNSLMRFRLTADEIYEKKFIYFTSNAKYLELTEQMVNADKSKKNPVITTKMKPHSPEPTIMTQPRNLSANESIEAFAQQHIFKKDGASYCYGNNMLCYLNLAYNNLGYLSVKKLLDVLRFQEKVKRTPRGLVCVCIEGNNTPSVCEELIEIRYIIAGILRTDSSTTGKDSKRKTQIIKLP